MPRTVSDQFPLRLPDGMRDKIKKSAAENNRTMNAEIVECLEQKFSNEENVFNHLEKLQEKANLIITLLSE